MAKASNLVIAQAFAKSDKGNSDNNGKGSDNSNSKNSSSNDKSDGSDKSNSDKSSGSDNSNSDKSSGSSDYSSATLVCVSRDSVLSTLGLGSSSSSSSDDKSSKSDDKSSKSDDKSSKSDDKSSKSDDKSSKSDDKSGKSDDKNNDGKVTICHIPPGNPSQQQTLSVGESAVSAHMAHGDYMGACSGVTQSYIESLPTCGAIVGAGSPTVTGVWVPDTAVGNSTALNDFYTQAQAGSAAVTPSDQAGNDTLQKSYREIRGQ